MSLVGETLLSAIHNSASPTMKKLGRDFGIDKDLKKLSIALSKFQAVLNDAEAKKRDNVVVKDFLNDLIKVAYDADDVLDEVATAATREKVTNLPSITNDFISRLDSKIKEIFERLDEIAKDKDDLGLREGVRVAELRERDELQTSSLIDDTRTFGREKDVEKIVKSLVSDECCGNVFAVLPIFGMGGLGKTTLAQLVFNDPLVAKNFDFIAWVCVSDDFNAGRITKSILESIESKSCDLQDLPNLQKRLCEKLNGKKFLVVLDDVWNEKENDWDVLSLPFRAGALGSKVIVTTRNKEVASIMGTLPTYHLKRLSEEDCWSLFEGRAFVDGNEASHPNLVSIGKQIVVKCGGLPLAAKALGGLLRAKTEVGEWEMILQSDIWELEDEEKKILPALRLSYNHLPAHLKRCFMYCSIFPKDYNFDKENLVLLWMAEGFIHRKGKRSLEEVASKYFDDLLLRSFFEPSKTELSKTKPSKFVMHDLIHDLAQSVAGEMCFILEPEKLRSIPEMVRHSSVLVDAFKSVEFEALSTKVSLRTMLLLRNKFSHRENFNMTVLHDLVCNLRRLRSLDMSHLPIEELPDSVGDLMHMRYLDLSHTDVKELPKSFSSLCNLQTLILADCNKLVLLPEGTKDLMKLRYLDLTGCWHLRSMPPSFGRLTSLQRLHRLVGNGIRELKDMNELRATLCIDRVEDVVNIEDAKEASLKRKPFIHKLVLRWSRSRHVQNAIDEELLECLEPHTNLRELTIDVYPGTKFPNWMGDSALSLLESIEFIHCSYCKTLPPLGQLPFLKYLTICMMQELESIGREFYGSGRSKGFLSLKTLRLEEMRNLKEWKEIDDGEFPVLEKLEVLNCPTIDNIPKFPSLNHLLLDDCHQTVLSSVHLLTSLTSLQILNFRKVDLLPSGLLQPLTALKNLKIKDFYRLKSLQDELGLQDLKSLQRLEISCCPKLLSFAEKGLPSSLQYLSIDMCSALKDVPTGLQHLIYLEQLIVSKCPNLVSFREEKLGRSLKNLRLSSCANLESLPTCLHELEKIESLSIQSCPKVACLPASGLPRLLRSLSIMECALLEERCAEGGPDWPKIEHIPKKHIGESKL